MIIARNNTGNSEIILRQGLAGYEIIVDGQFLMSSASGDSSVALVELGLAELAGRKSLKVLIAGLGLGFSLRTALSNPTVTEVIIVELEPQIIEWHQENIIPDSAGTINDSRVKVMQQDFLHYIDGCWTKFDLIALDIDNGPDWLSHESNFRLYTIAFIERLQELLKPGGVLTFWSAAEASQLAGDLKVIFGNVTENEVNDHNGVGKAISAFIYLAKRN